MNGSPTGEIIPYDEACKQKCFQMPCCPFCGDKWVYKQPNIIIQTGIFRDRRMAQAYVKTCDSCGRKTKVYL